jgi:hypothetical protein
LTQRHDDLLIGLRPQAHVLEGDLAAYAFAQAREQKAQCKVSV